MKDKILKEVFKIEKLKEEQEKIIDYILNKEDVIGVLRTGFGKSICYQLPSLILEGLTIIISPLIALMQDQVDSLLKKNISAAYINSTLTCSEQQKVYDNILKSKYKILYVSGERLENKTFRKVISNVKVSLITIDEAHTLSWGDTFRYSLNNIYEFINLFNYKIPILALSATVSKPILNKIIQVLKLNNPKIVYGPLDRTNIYYMTKVSTNKKKDMMNFLKIHENEIGIVFCLTIKTATHIYNYLKLEGYKVGLYHGKLESSEKKEIVNNFILDNYDIMVCSSSFGLGIDKPNVRYVINYDIPLTIEELVQELGRCGRDGKYAESLVLFNPNDVKSCIYFIENIDNPRLSFKENYLLKKDANKSLDKVIEYVTTRKCLHKFILNQFGTDLNFRCNNCSNCLNKHKL